MGAQFALLGANRALWAAALGWFVAQLIKTLASLRKDKQLNLGHLVASGGMPSSHSALVVGLATAIARIDGLQSTPFALAAVFAGVVMYDAAGVRRAAGRQAEILNRLVEDLVHMRGVQEQKLRELLGHTPVEVLVGAVLGVLVGVLL